MQRNRSEIKELQAIFDEVIKPSMQESKSNQSSLQGNKGETRFDSQTQEMQSLIFGKGDLHSFIYFIYIPKFKKLIWDIYEVQIYLFLIAQI